MINFQNSMLKVETVGGGVVVERLGGRFNAVAASQGWNDQHWRVLRITLLLLVDIDDVVAIVFN